MQARPVQAFGNLPEMCNRPEPMLPPSMSCTTGMYATRSGHLLERHPAFLLSEDGSQAAARTMFSCLMQICAAQACSMCMLVRGTSKQASEQASRFMNVERSSGWHLRLLYLPRCASARRCDQTPGSNFETCQVKAKRQVRVSLVKVHTFHHEPVLGADVLMLAKMCHFVF